MLAAPFQKASSNSATWPEPIGFAAVVFRCSGGLLVRSW
jgi:hypothetical protein